MKMYKLSVSIALFLVPTIIFCQSYLLQVQVMFADGKIYHARGIEGSDTHLKVEFLHSHSVYDFDRNGYVLSSAGQYKPGERVKYIWTWRSLERLEERDVIRDTADEMTVGISFAGEKSYFGWVYPSEEPGKFAVGFYHTHSKYIMQKENGVWKVLWTDIGTYAVGTPLTWIYRMADEKVVFYSAE